MFVLLGRYAMNLKGSNESGKHVYQLLDLVLPAGLAVGNYTVYGVLVKPHVANVMDTSNWIDWHTEEFELY
jgi:hypothetical protein